MPAYPKRPAGPRERRPSSFAAGYGRAGGAGHSRVCQLAGSRKYDLNKDGVANYGLYADLLAYMRRQTGGKAASAVLFRSAEAYLRTWRLVAG